LWVRWRTFGFLRHGVSVNIEHCYSSGRFILISDLNYG
jgi:hypothetical protein